MRVESERLSYREFTRNDFELFYSVFSNEEVMKYAFNDQCRNEEELLPYFHEVLANNQRLEDRKAYEFAVYLRSEHRFIGFADIEIHNKNVMGGCGEVGYFLLPDFWRKGYATEMVNALLEFCFRHLGLHRVSARCNGNNISSENIMKKTGMVKEGEFRKVRFKNNGWDNEKHYSILKEEWSYRDSIIIEV